MVFYKVIKGKNVLLLTGDIHHCFAVVVEAPALSEGTMPLELGTAVAVESALLRNNPHLVFADLAKHTFVRLTLTQSWAQFDVMAVDSIRLPSSPMRLLKTLRVPTGQSRFE